MLGTRPEPASRPVPVLVTGGADFVGADGRLLRLALAGGHDSGAKRAHPAAADDGAYASR